MNNGVSWSNAEQKEWLISLQAEKNNAGVCGGPHTATQTAHLLGLDRKTVTVNRYSGLFRAAIHAHQSRQIAALAGVL